MSVVERMPCARETSLHDLVLREDLSIGSPQLDLELDKSLKGATQLFPSTLNFSFLLNIL